jgi:hypothetical protein
MILNSILRKYDFDSVDCNEDQIPSIAAAVYTYARSQTFHSPGFTQTHMPCPLLQLFLEVPTDTNYSKTLASTEMLTQETVYENHE